MSGRIFCLMGKSVSGKDTIYRLLLRDESLGLKKVVIYTTRPKRQKEENGREYHFCEEDTYQRFKEEGRIIEERAYETYYGLWRYFTADDGQIDLGTGDYLIIGTLEAFRSLKSYFGAGHVIPLFIRVDDGIRLARALARERKQKEPAYEEMCRRFLSDAEDFSEEKIREAGISIFFDNDTDSVADCAEKVIQYVRSFQAPVLGDREISDGN